MNLAKWEIEQYVPLVEKIIAKGEQRDTRAGKAFSIFGETIIVDSRDFPMLQGRKMYYKSVIGELAAMLRGAKTVKEFQDLGCNYWNDWADREGNLVLDYGTSWLDFNGVNQLELLIDSLKNNPYDRRMIISGWRPDNIPKLSLPCCHLLYQWYVRDGKYLDMIWYQRSVDVMVGLPSDIVFAAMWNILIAQTTNYLPGKITFVLGDTHVYANHYMGARQYVNQALTLFIPKDSMIMPVQYSLDTSANVFNFHPSMLKVLNYSHMPQVKFQLNV